MDAPTVIVGVFLFLSIGFLQVPGTQNGDSSTFCVHRPRAMLANEHKVLLCLGACRDSFVWWLRINNVNISANDCSSGKGKTQISSHIH